MSLAGVLKKTGNTIKKIYARKSTMAYILLAPTLLGIILFQFYPVIESLRLSLYNTDYLTKFWVGLRNYTTILKDPDFYGSVYNTVYMGVMTLLINIPGAFVIASMINSCKWGKNFFKSAIYIPNIASIVAASTIFLGMFHPTDLGAMNYIFSLFGLGPYLWFSSIKLARITIVLMAVWQNIGYTSLIFLAGLQSVPAELYEASEVDGATRFKRWLYITIPNMKPIFAFVFITGTISAMQRFGDVWMVSGNTGQPGGTLRTIVLYIYTMGFQRTQFGLASAAAYLLFIMILILTLINTRLIRWNKD